MIEVRKSSAADRTRTAASVKSGKKAASSDKVFSVDAAAVEPVDDADNSGGTDSLSSNIAAAGIESLLALQETQLDAEPQSREQVWEYGHGLLQQLRQLQQELLFGTVTLARLHMIREFVRSHRGQAGANPMAQDIIAQIETRVAVELAKYGQDLT